MRPPSESEVSTILSTDREDESSRPAPTLMEYLALRGPSQHYISHGHPEHYNYEREVDWLGGMNGPITRYALSQGLACLPATLNPAAVPAGRQMTSHGDTE